jgi:hypothetical protein
MRKFVALLALVTAGLAAPRALAYPEGIYDVARPGMGCSCHSFVGGLQPPGASVLLIVDDTPLDQFAGYQPGRDEPYTLTVWVLGPVLPSAGFNLEATAGELEPVDDSVKTVVTTECTYMERWVANCSGKKCGIVRDDDCPVFDRYNPACKRCPAADEDDDTKCRACDDVVVLDVQATHSETKVVPYFEMKWTAPSDPVDVEVFIAGNSVSGEGTTGFDLWSFIEPNPVLLRPAAP